MLLGALHFTTAIATANALGPAGLLVFALAWTVLGAGVYRCADLRKLQRSMVWEIGVVVVHALVGTLFCAVMWHLTWIGATALFAAFAWGSYQRGQPRRVTRLSYGDSGMGMSAPPELIGYYLRGLMVVVLAGFGNAI